MNPDRWQEVKRLYNSAMELEPAHREAFLENACGGDESLRKEVERLLARQAEGEDLLGTPAVEIAAKALAQDRKDEPPPDYVGRSLLHYRITEKIGEGGMGVVYKARDTHLDRSVAIKMLPAEAMTDPERKRRFIQEAKAASALNHPNIIDIHDINSDAGVDFIVMEHVAGKTLDQRIGRKGLRIGEALKCAVQVADALAAAHAVGIVHRDLKPANIMVTETGRVKVLDFGLAKLSQPLQSETSGSASMIESLTDEGRILGTVAYMSPEQAEGKAVDARSDIFSFGSVLYEMLTGRQAFQGDSRVSTLSAIIEKEPAPLSTNIPRDLEKIVTRCLRKDPARRFQAMADLKVELEELKEAAESGRLDVERAAVTRVSRGRLVVAAAAVIALVAAGWYWLGRWRSAEPEALLASVPLTSYPGAESTPSSSPDGTQVAFQWCTEGPSANCDIYIKQMGVEPPSRLTTDPAEDLSPAWSPDGNSIAFLRKLSQAKAALLIVPQRGGHERVLTEFNPPSFLVPCLAWTPDSRWLAFPSAESGKREVPIVLLSVDTGEKRILTENGGYGPAFSPDGKNLAFVKSEAGIWLFRLADGYVPQGVPELLRADEDVWPGLAWTSDGSEIVFSRGVPPNGTLWRMKPSLTAKPRRIAVESENAMTPTIAGHGNCLAFAVQRQDTNIWRIELKTPASDPGTPEKLIGSTRQDLYPAYSPDGRKIALLSDRAGTYAVWVCNSDGSNPVQLTSSGYIDNGPRWSPDGRTIAIPVCDEKYQYIYVINENERIPRRVTSDAKVVDKWPYWSHDGRSFDFSSMRSGMSEIWRMPAAGGRPIQITPDGEERDLPQESPDGRFLYYIKVNTGSWSGRSIWRLPVGGGEEEKVLDSIYPKGGFRVRQRGVYYFALPDEKGRSDVCLYEFATGKTRRILTMAKDIWPFIEVSPDEQTILYTQLDHTGIDLMLVENFR